MKPTIRSIIKMMTALILFATHTHAFIKIELRSEMEVVISIDAQKHLDYGFSYPLTYQFSLPQNSAEWQVYKGYGALQNWAPLNIQTGDTLFNAEEVVRFDYGNYKAYVSVGFSHVSDSIFIKFSNPLASGSSIHFDQICKYYDNRDAAVTCSADDMAGWSEGKFKKTLHILRRYKIWVSCGINTEGATTAVYKYIQAQLDSGYVEAASHSRTHPSKLPFTNYKTEISGCKADLITNLIMPPLFRNGEREYVYTWIAPNGFYDQVIDSLVGVNQHLCNRLYYSDFDGFSTWNSKYQTYFPNGVTRAFDPPMSQLGWGIGSNDTTDLNRAFDQVVAKGSVYHVMCHPNVVEWDKNYPWAHLDHISNRNNIWYVSMGHLFLYHYAQENYIQTTDVATNDAVHPIDFSLMQNYPNPFNSATTIRYRLLKPAWIRLSVFNATGQMVATLDEKCHDAGEYSVVWNAAAMASGLYFYRLDADDRVQIRSMILLR